ncbi:GNAT family N-acetyltransferase [Fontibacillus sp. BL9]|uniref:GNAT family N-acetyltransferase n=1 Tax=Fontibacillus sp. BL9 TaxID=3389971 RepID=UPI00397E8FC9
MGKEEMKVVTFQHSHLEAAAMLLSAHHVEERTKTPSLQKLFEEPVHAGRVIDTWLEKENVSGIAAFRGAELIGYMMGRLETDKQRERYTWVDYAGTAIAAEESAELYREMYAVIAAEWVKAGSFKHYVLVPGGDTKAMDGWLRLGFGYEQVHGVQAIPSDISLPLLDSEICIRLATEEDEREVRKIATLIMEHQAESPVWAPAFIEDRGMLQEGFVELMKDPTAYFWVASQGQDILGFQAFYPAQNSDSNMMIPDSCICLGVGATVPYARGKGVATHLIKHGFDHARKAGYLNCMTDWRMTNLESSRFWPKQNFLPYAYRLVRHIDPRIAWATGKA